MIFQGSIPKVEVRQIVGTYGKIAYNPAYGKDSTAKSSRDAAIVNADKFINAEGRIEFFKTHKS